MAKKVKEEKSLQDKTASFKARSKWIPYAVICGLGVTAPYILPPVLNEVCSTAIKPMYQFVLSGIAEFGIIWGCGFNYLNAERKIPQMALFLANCGFASKGMRDTLQQEVINKKIEKAVDTYNKKLVYNG